MNKATVYLNFIHLCNDLKHPFWIDKKDLEKVRKKYFSHTNEEERWKSCLTLLVEYNTEGAFELEEIIPNKWIIIEIREEMGEHFPFGWLRSNSQEIVEKMLFARMVLGEHKKKSRGV